VDHRDYVRLEQRIAPGVRFNQDVYAECIESAVTERDVWLDAGCGRRILHMWRSIEDERDLVDRAKLVIGCDVDAPAIRLHRTVKRLSVADLTALPYRSGCASLVTCNMVVEHLEQPGRVFAEFTRILRPGGRVIIHTPNAWSYFVFASRFLPRWGKLRLDQRPPDEIFPTKYRANTRSRLGRLMAQAGLLEQSFRYLASNAAIQNVRWISALELSWIRLTLLPILEAFRVTILATYRKP